MHTRDILELAALVACHGPVLVESPVELPQAAIERYWSASRCRLDRWGRSLQRFAQAPNPAARAVLEEILASEVLTRVWAATLVNYDRHRGIEEAGPPARSILAGHLEARNRALRILLTGRGLKPEQAAAIDVLRRRAERWTDIFLARLSGAGDLREFAHDAQAVDALAADLSTSVGRPNGCSAAWDAVLATFRAMCSQLSPTNLPNADLGTKIAASVLQGFGSEMFDSLGLPSSLWAARLSCATLDVETLIADLFASESAPPATGDFIIRRNLLE